MTYLGLVGRELQIDVEKTDQQFNVTVYLPVQEWGLSACRGELGGLIGWNGAPKAPRGEWASVWEEALAGEKSLY